MRIVIYGAGAIGSVVGGYLSMAGFEVILVGRSGHVKAIETFGLKLITPVGTYILRIPAVTTLAEIDFKVDDLVFLCMKGQDTQNALDDLMALTESSRPIFCFQNGVRNEELTLKHFSKVYGVRVNLPSYYLVDGEVTAGWHPPGGLIIGRYPSGSDDLADAVAANLRASGFVVMVSPEVMPYKWGKLIGNLSNSIIAITDAAREDNHEVIESVRHEAEEILTKADISWVSRAELEKEWPEGSMKTGKNLQSSGQSSTWQSMVRHPGSIETEFLTGEIVRVARRLGQQAPINQKLLEIMTDMTARHEKPGKYTPVQLKELLGL